MAPLKYIIAASRQFLLQTAHNEHPFLRAEKIATSTELNRNNDKPIVARSHIKAVVSFLCSTRSVEPKTIVTTFDVAKTAIAAIMTLVRMVLAFIVTPWCNRFNDAIAVSTTARITEISPP